MYILYTTFRYADVKGTELENCIKWCSVKTVRRAQEKVQRSYGEVCSGREREQARAREFFLSFAHRARSLSLSLFSPLILCLYH